MKTTNEVAIGHGIVLTNDNAKKFATRLKKTLKENSIDFKTSKCYDILAKTFGSSNWHELSQHLNNTQLEKNLTPQPQNNDNSKLNSIFDLPWVEFKYMVSKMTTNLEFDFHTKEFLDVLLDILHENQQKSEIYWDKLIEFLDSSERSFRSDIEFMPVHQYTTELNPTLTSEQVDKHIKKVAKAGNSVGGYKVKFSAEKIESFFNMLRFLKNENFILRDLNTNFAVSEVLQIKDGIYKSDYYFVNSLLHLADVNNEHITYNNNFYKKLSFHDLIVQLYARESMLNYLYIAEKNLLPEYAKKIAVELFENHKFIAYLCSHLKTYVYNSIKVTNETKLTHYIEKYPQGIDKTTNVIEYNMVYVPHGYILKYNLENLDISQFKKEIIDPDTHEIISDFVNLHLKINLYDNTILMKTDKSTILKNLRSDHFQPKFKNDNSIFFSSY